MEFPIRINKYLAQKNYASRREADELVERGFVTINGAPATLGDMVNEGDDVNVIDHERAPYTYYAYYKPRGIVTIGAQGNETEITDATHFPVDVFPIGRLDKDSEGLIIMTNDGRITDPLLSPDHTHEKEYAVTVDRPITHQAMVKMRNGVRIDIGRKKYTTKKTRLRRTSKNSFDIILTEGKNRQIRKMCGAVGFKVIALKRFRIMDISLDDMKPGQYRDLGSDFGDRILKNT